MAEANKGTSTCPVCHNPTFCYPDGRKSCLRCEWEEEKEMTKEEAVAKSIYDSRNGSVCKPWSLLTKDHKTPYFADATCAIAAADKWDADETLRTRKYPSTIGRPRPISPGLDSAIQDELDHPPASIMEEGK